MILKDGLYRVKTNIYVAGFVVKNGFVYQCAPILRKLINNVSNDYLLSIAEWICE